MSASNSVMSVSGGIELGKQPIVKMKNGRFSLQSPKTWSALLFRSSKKKESDKYRSEQNLSETEMYKCDGVVGRMKRTESLQSFPFPRSQPEVDAFASFTEFLGRDAPTNSPDFGPSPAYGSQNSLNLGQLSTQEMDVGRMFSPTENADNLVTARSLERVAASASSEINSKSISTKSRINQFFRPRSLSDNKRPTLSNFLTKRRSSVAGSSNASNAQAAAPDPASLDPDKTVSPTKVFRKFSFPNFRPRSKSETRGSSPNLASPTPEDSDSLPTESEDSHTVTPSLPPAVPAPVNPQFSTPQRQNFARKSHYRQRSKSESRSSSSSTPNLTAGLAQRRRSVGVSSQTKSDFEEVQRRYPRRPKASQPTSPPTLLNPTPIALEVLPEGVQVHHESRPTLSPESAVLAMPTVMELALSAIVVNVEPIVRRRSASIALGSKDPDPNLFANAREFKSFRTRLENVRKTARSVLQKNEGESDQPLAADSGSNALGDDNNAPLTPKRKDTKRSRQRKSFSGDRAKSVNLDRTKSRSVDQSLANALDADVFNRFGNASSTNHSRDEDETRSSSFGPRPTTPTGDRRSSGSGSTLKLPPEDTTMYTVQASDTLSSLAARFDTTPSELAALNRLSARLLFPGQVLYVPHKIEEASQDVAAAGRSTPTSPFNQPVEKDGSVVFGTPPKETPQESAVLESIRAPGSPRICRRDPLSSLWGSTQSGGQGSSTEMELNSTEVPLSLEEERIQDREAYDKFLKINVRHITDGQGVVAGVLLVTPNALMFDPNVSDPLVIENGPEKYGVIAPLECVASAGLYSDIAHMRLSDVSPNKSIEVTKPDLYYPLDCPLYKKYVLAAQANQTQVEDSVENQNNQPQERLDQIALQLNEAINDENQTESQTQTLELEEESSQSSGTRVSALTRQLSETVNPLLANLCLSDFSPSSSALIALEETGESKDSMSPMPGTSPNLATIIECVPETKPEDQEHVIRLQVKMDSESGSSPSERVSAEEEQSRHVKSTSSASSVEKMGEDEFKPKDPFSLLLIAPKRSESGTRSKEDTSLEHEETFTRSLEEKPSVTDPIGITNQARARHISAGGNRSHVRNSRFVPGGSETSQDGTPPSSSSPESRGQKMLKRLSYPLVWMGESFSSDKDPAATQTSEQAPSESVFSRVFSSSGLFTRAPEECAKVRDLKEYGATAKVLSEAGIRRASNTSEVTARPGRAVLKASPSSAPTTAKMGYRSMVSVDDVPELFASFDKLIPKPAQACEDPPMYLRIRMGKPLNKKISHSTPLMSYGKKKMRPEYWFSIPRDRTDHLFRFFLLWTPNVYGEIDVVQAGERGFLLIESDTELWDEPTDVQVRSKVTRKRRSKKDAGKDRDTEEEGGDDEERGNDIGDIAKESWEIVSMNVYGSSLSSLELDNYLPELIGLSDILTDDCRRQIAKHLPARAEGYPWTLVFSTAQHGFSLNSMYRKMAKVNSPILLVIEDTQGHIFGALTSCELRVSELFYGTGESYLFAFSPELRIFGWTGENTYFVKGNNESIAIGAGDGKFGLWLDGDLYQGRTQPCKTFGNDPLTPDEDFLVRALECWAFV